MKKMKKCSKGFTLTELAIVIAVIAILIAVLVPTFVSIIDRANKTSDNILVTNVNEALTLDETTNGTPSNIDEALAVAETAGYNVSNLSTSSEGTLIVWNETSNEFIYVNSELDSDGNFTEVDGEAITSVASCNLWVITSSYNSDYSEYSQYISGTVEAGTTLEVSAGISVGDNEDVNITYTNDDGKEKTVTFVTKGGTLTVNDSAATVVQYGDVSKVVVTAVDATNSFHANGKVENNIEIEEGHLVIEDGATAAAILVTGKDASKVSVVNNSSSTESIPVAATDPDVAEILDTIVTGSGKSDVKSIAYDAIALECFDGGLGTSDNPYLISTADQFVNIGIAQDVDGVRFYNSMLTHAYYFKLTKDIDLNEATKIYTIGGIYSITYSFQGELDGAGHTVYGLKTKNVYFACYTRCDATIKNIVINQQNGYAITLAYCVNQNSNYLGEVTFSDITVKGDKVTTFTNNDSSFVNFVGGTVNFVGCTNSVDIAVSSGYYFGIFVGGYAFQGSDIWINNITFDTCVNTATVTGSHIGFFIGNSNATAFYTVNNPDFSDRDSTKTTGAATYITNCKNTGTISATLYCGAFCETSGSSSEAAFTTAAIAHQELNKSLTTSQFDTTNGTMEVTTAVLTAEVNENNGLQITTEETGTLTIAYRVSVSYKDSSGTSVGSNYVWVKLNVTAKVAPYVTSFVDCTNGKTYNGTAYDSLNNSVTGSTESSKDSYGHSYKLVQNTDGTYAIVVGEINLMSKATQYTINTGSVYYTISLTSDGEEIGTLTGKI